jgi:hypothetical protein
MKEPTQIMGYADDWVVITSNKAPLLAENRLKKITDSISKWAEENGFEISTEKTKTMLIHRRRPKIERRLKLKLFIKNERIEMVRQHRILSMMKGRTGKHTYALCNAKARALKKLNIIKSLSHSSWGSDQKRS